MCIVHLFAIVFKFYLFSRVQTLQGNADGGTENPDVLNKNSGLENINNGKLAPNEVSNVCAEEELETGTVGIPNDVTPDLMVCEVSYFLGPSLGF